MYVGRTFNSLLLSTLRYNSANQFKFYSLYPSDHVKPIFKIDEQELLYKETELSKLLLQPVKAAESIDTCSEFHDPLIRKFTNYLMKGGNRVLARKLVEETLENIKILQLQKYYDTLPEYRKNIIIDPKILFYQAVKNASPILELQKMSRGGIIYEIPVPINENRAQFLSMKWLIQAGQEKGNSDKFSDVMAKEVITAANNEGRVIKKKNDLHSQCEANRAYAHYRWL